MRGRLRRGAAPRRRGAPRRREGEAAAAEAAPSRGSRSSRGGAEAAEAERRGGGRAPRRRGRARGCRRPRRRAEAEPSRGAEPSRAAEEPGDASRRGRGGRRARGSRGSPPSAEPADADGRRAPEPAEPSPRPVRRPDRRARRRQVRRRSPRSSGWARRRSPTDAVVHELYGDRRGARRRRGALGRGGRARRRGRPRGGRAPRLRRPGRARVARGAAVAAGRRAGRGLARARSSARDPPPRAPSSRCRCCSRPGMEARLRRHDRGRRRRGRCAPSAPRARGHEAVDERAARQLSQEEKAARATYVGRNDGTRRGAGVASWPSSLSKLSADERTHARPPPDPPPSARRSRARPRAGAPSALRGSSALVLAVLVASRCSRGRVRPRRKEITLPLRHEDIIRQQARDKDLDPALIAAVIYAESQLRDGQTSAAGAKGLMQITAGHRALHRAQVGRHAVRARGPRAPRRSTSPTAPTTCATCSTTTTATCCRARRLQRGRGQRRRVGRRPADVRDSGTSRFPETQAYVRDVVARRRERRTAQRVPARARALDPLPVLDSAVELR